MSENQKLIDSIKKIKPVMTFLKEFGFDDSIIEENLLIFSSYKMKLTKCVGCKGIDHCKQTYSGFAPSLTYNGSQIVIDYLPCKYQKLVNESRDAKSRLHLIASDFKAFNLDDVYNTEERKELFLKVQSIYNSYKNKQSTKGLYVYGPYGSGKSFILAWLASKLVEMKANVLFAYYPELVRRIKSSIGEGLLEDYITELKEVEVLFLDDIGGEANSDFIRDEVLGAVLQTRMCNGALTFMSSNLEPKTLLAHLSSGSKETDVVKGSRLFERITSLMDFVELKDKNYRKLS